VDVSGRVVGRGQIVTPVVLGVAGPGVRRGGDAEEISDDPLNSLMFEITGMSERSRKLALPVAYRFGDASGV
jgi:hypothetical protein